jgi:hypothetical protein
VTADFVLAGTGSRSLRTAPREIQVEAMEQCMGRVAQRVIEHGSRLVVMSGGAEGFDELLARVAMRLSVRLWLALPNRGYVAHYWGRASLLKRDRLAEWAEIAAYAEKTTYVMERVAGVDKITHEGLHANFWRNRFLVEQADDFVVLGPVKPKSGTEHCVKAIKQAGKWREDMVLGPESLSHAEQLQVGGVSP